MEGKFEISLGRVPYNLLCCWGFQKGWLHFVSFFCFIRGIEITFLPSWILIFFIYLSRVGFQWAAIYYRHPFSSNIFHENLPFIQIIKFVILRFLTLLYRLQESRNLVPIYPILGSDTKIGGWLLHTPSF